MHSAELLILKASQSLSRNARAAESARTIRKPVNSISLEPDTPACPLKRKGGPAKGPALVPALSFLVSALTDSTARC